MAKNGKPRRIDGGLFKRQDSQFWQVWYRDRKGEIVRRSKTTLQHACGREGGFIPSAASSIAAG